MKQMITVEQLGELSQGQRERLKEWWKPRMKDGDWFYGTYGGRDEIDKWMISPYCVDSGVYGAGSCPDDDAMPDKDALPLLSIGQCIELLENKNEFYGLHKSRTDGRFKVYGENGEKYMRIYDSTELIDALFESVKAVL